MRTLNSIKKTLGDMKEPLYAGLRFLSRLDANNPAVKKSIYLHCAMLVFYGFLEQRLDDSSFETFFNEKLTYLNLDDDHFFSTNLSQLSPDDAFQASSLLKNNEAGSDQLRSELFFLTQFAPVLMVELQKIRNAEAAQIASLRQWKMIAGAGVILALVASVILREVLLFAYASPVIGILYLAAIGLVVAERMMDRQIKQGLDDQNYSWLVWYMSPSVDANDLYDKMRKFLPENQGDLQENEDILPKNADDTVSFIKVQSLFFKTPSLLTVRPEDFDASFEASTHSVGAH